MSRSNDHHLNGADMKSKDGGASVASYRSKKTDCTAKASWRLITLLLLIVLVVPCAGYLLARQNSDRAHCVYATTGHIGSLEVRPDGDRRLALIGEHPDGGGPVTLSLLDLASGGRKRLLEVDGSMLALYLGGSTAISRDGQIALVRPPPKDLGKGEIELMVFDRGGRWRSISDPTAHPALRSFPAWSPDSTRLAYSRSPRGWQAVIELVVAAIPRVGEYAVEQVVLVMKAPQSTSSPEWSADGRSIFFARTSPGRKMDLVALDWRSRKETVLLSDEWVEPLPIAEDTGDLICLTWSADEKQISVWKLAAGSRLERTQLTLSEMPLYNARTISPDGRRLAFLSKSGKVVIGDLLTGDKRALDVLPGRQLGAAWDPLLGEATRAVGEVEWALGGSSLVVLETRKKGTKVWTVSVPEVGQSEVGKADGGERR